MQNDLSQRLKICIAIETGIGEIYREFSRIFPDGKDLWGELAHEEENHAAILAIGSRYANLGMLPDFIVPDSLSHMRETMGLVDSIKAVAQAGSLSMKEALEMSLKVEQTLEESYLLDVMTRETQSEIVERLRRLLADTESHITRIKDFMRRVE